MELSRERLVLFTGAGFLGGLAGWAAAEPLAALGNVYLRALLHGAVIGVFVGAFIGAIEGPSAGHKNQTWQGVKLGGLAGLVGGGSGLLMGELAFDLFGGLGGRVIGWAVFGLAAGLGGGWGGRSFARLRHGGMGGRVRGAQPRAVVERQNGKVFLGRGGGEVGVTHGRVAQSVQLKNGDRVGGGGTLPLFRERVGS